MSWTPELELKLKELWRKGLTGSEIAKSFGTTRSAILGKVHRLKLEARTVSKKTTATAKVKTENNSGEAKQEKLTGRRNRFKALLLDQSFPPEQPTKLEDLTDDHCRWPLGKKMEPATFFCGRKPLESKNTGKKYPYCELHLLYGYVSKSDKEEDKINEEELPQLIEKKIRSA